MTRLHVLDLAAVGHYRGTIVAVPGLGESAQCLVHTAQHWAGCGFRVITVDPRGHGASPGWTTQLLQRHPGDVIVQDILATLQAVVTRQDCPLILFGHSAGGASATAVAAAWSHRVSAVVLEDPFWRLAVTPYQDRAVAEAAAVSLAHLKAIGHAQRIAEMSALFPHWPADEFEGWSRSKQDMQIALVHNGNVIPTRSWPTLLRELADAGIAVQIITGTARVGMTSNHRAILRSLGAHLTIIRGTSHFVRRDARDVFHQTVDTFLAEKLTDQGQPTSRTTSQ